MSERAIQLTLNRTWPRYEYKRRSWGHSVRRRKRVRPRPSWLVRMFPPKWASVRLEGASDIVHALSAIATRLGELESDPVECHSERQTP